MKVTKLFAGIPAVIGDEIFEPLVRAPGDHVQIPAHRRHRIEWTDEGTVWPALHYDRD